MNQLQVGIRLESLGLSFRDALTAVARLAVHGVQFDAVGELAPQQLSQTGVRELRNLLRSHDVELTALGCPMRHGLDSPDGQERRIDYLERSMALSYDLGARVIIVEAGRVPDVPAEGAVLPEDEELRLRSLTDALSALARHGDRTGTTLALESGLEPPERLRAFIDRFDSAGLGVNFEAANLLMNGYPPAAAVRSLGDKLVHAQARDARRASPSKTAQEVPLGHGDIDWLDLLATFEEIDYRRWLVIKRDMGARGEARPAEIGAAVEFLRRLGVG
jgi:sugar phosphate isomerase/epimerase